MILMAKDEVEGFNNEIQSNSSANVSIISYLSTETKFDDPQYDPYPEAVYIHDNKISGGGDKPQGKMALVALALRGRLPDIVYDGIVDEKKLVEGALPDKLKIYIKNNGKG